MTTKHLPQCVTGNIPLFQSNILYFHQWIWDTLTYRTQKCRDASRRLSSRHKMTKTSTMASRCLSYTCHGPPKCQASVTIYLLNQIHSPPVMIKSKTSLQTPIYLLQCFLSHLINRDNLFLPSSTSLHPPPIYFIPSLSPKLCRAPHSDSHPSRFISSRSPRESEVKLTEFRVYNFIYLD